MNPASTAVLDQIDAAAADTHRRIRRAAQIGGWDLQEQVGPVVLRVLHGFLTSRLRPCEHLTGPAPCCGFAWLPGQIMCTACASAVGAQAAGSVEAVTCSGCGRYAARGLAAGASALGPVVITYLLCRVCVADEHEALR